MEPVTHILTGACLSRTGLNRRAAYTTLAMAVAAELPDIDTLWSLRGPITGFEHHRGITHTFLAIPFEAAVVVGAIYALHRWRLHKSADGNTSLPGQRALTTAPINWLLLYAFTLLALLSHLFLDFTNNYGLRPFFPFNPHWYAASIVFIFDPLIFLLLLSAIILPPLFRLVSSEVGARRQPFVARGWAITALLLIVALWTLRETQHNRAIQLAMAQSLAAPQPASSTDTSASPDAPAPADPMPIYLQAQRALANPDPLSPFRWYTVTDFGPLYQLGEASTINAVLTPSQFTQPKLNPSTALIAAESSFLGRTYLDWSSVPFITVTPASELGLDDSGNRAAAGHTLVQFVDPRFMGDVPILHSAAHTPLTGKVELDARDHVVSESMDGKLQRP
jgi:inner membrane protein